jgi:rubrerythrin
MFSAQEVFDLAIKIEENGEAYYRQAVQAVGDSSIKELLQWLADEEARHRKYFLELKMAAKPGGEADWAELVSGAFLQSAVSDHAFSLDDIDFFTIRDPGELLRIAIGFEEDSLAFYEILQTFVTEADIARHVREIMKEEKRHIELIEERIKGTAPPRGSKN